MPLSAVKIKHAEAAAKPIKLYDERGQFLIVMSNGGKWWRFKYIAVFGRVSQYRFKRRQGGAQ